LKIVIGLAFGEQLKLYVLPLLKENKIVLAFQSLINKVRGKRQEDIDTARDNLAAFRNFDVNVDIQIGMNSMVQLFSAVDFATGTSLTDDERRRKFHQCVFNDPRTVMHNCVLDSIARKHTYQESVDHLYAVMELIPVEKRRLTASVNMTNSTTDKNAGNSSQQKTLFCYPFQFGSCSDRNCQLRHEIVAEAARKAELCSVDMGENNNHAKGQDPAREKLDFNLSNADKEYFRVSSSQRLGDNPDGLPAQERHSINAVLAYDQSPDQLFDQYVDACHQQTVSSPNPRPRATWI
jgi:hypothetical protein